MTQATLPVASSEFADGKPAQGTEVYAQDNYIVGFLNGNNLDATDNIKVSGVFPWTNRHSWTISDANNDNLSLLVGAVMTSGKYGLNISSAVAQINAPLVYMGLSNASSTVSIVSLVDAGSGSTLSITKSGNGAAIALTQSGASNTEALVKLDQAGTGAICAATLRTLTGLNAEFLAKTITSATTINNTATETNIADLSTTLPADFLKEGTTIRGRVRGIMATPGSAPATARIRVYCGASLLLDTGAVTPTTSLVDSAIDVDFTLTCLTTGGSGTVEAQGLVLWGSNTAPAARSLGVAGTGAGNNAAITTDTTAANLLRVTFTWGSAISGCTTVIRSGHLEILK
jgi:hypothetical protein